jgi:hypothetical protein
MAHNQTYPTLGEKKANVKRSFPFGPNPSVLFFLAALYWHSLFMSNPGSRSASVTAAATLALLSCTTCLLVWGYVLLTLVNAPVDLQGHHFYQIYPSLFLSVVVIPSSLIALGFRTGLGILQLRPWARVAALIWAAIALVFCLALIALRPFETFVIPDTFVGPTQSLQQLASISFVILLLPASVWWLFLFRSKSAKLQFGTASEVNTKA